MSENKATTRRKVLQTIGAGAALGTFGSNQATAATVYEWALFLQDELKYQEGYTPQKRGETYVKGAFSNISQKYYYESPDVTIPAPVNDHGTAFTTNVPCTDIEYQYQDLLPWWQDYAEGNCSSIDTMSTANVLLLKGSDGAGGIAQKNGKYAIHNEGTSLTFLPSSYEKYRLNSESGTEGASTLLEEMGHVFQKAGDYEPEQTGDSDAVDGTSYVSPLGEGAQGGTNECGDPVNDSDGKKLTWDKNCTADNYFQ